MNQAQHIPLGEPLRGIAACWARHCSNPHPKSRSVNSWRATATRVVEAGEVGPYSNLVASTQGQTNSIGMLTIGMMGSQSPHRILGCMWGWRAQQIHYPQKEGHLCPENELRPSPICPERGHHLQRTLSKLESL